MNLDEQAVEMDQAGTLRANPLLGADAVVRQSEYSRSPWILLECVKTGLVYLANPPAYSMLDEEFAWEKTKPAEHARRVQEEPFVARLSKLSKDLRRTFRRGRRIQREAIHLIVATGKRSPVVVDLGCGSGRTLRDLADAVKQQCGIDVRPVGIEISANLAAKARENLRAFDGRVIHGPAIEGLENLASSSLDVILLSSYLEHEIQPLEVLKECFRSIVPGGTMVIKVPNFASINRRVRQGRWCGFRYPDHVNYFTPLSLRMIVEAAGFEISRMNFFDTLPTSDNMWLIARRPA